MQFEATEGNFSTRQKTIAWHFSRSGRLIKNLKTLGEMSFYSSNHLKIITAGDRIRTGGFQLGKLKAGHFKPIKSRVK